MCCDIDSKQQHQPSMGLINVCPVTKLCCPMLYLCLMFEADAGVIHISSSDEQDISEGAHRQVLSPEAKETEKKFGKKGKLVR